MNAFDARREYPWAMNPLRSFEELVRLATEHVDSLQSRRIEPSDRERLLNLYFLLCGCQQILSDYLHSRALAHGAGWLTARGIRTGSKHLRGLGQSAGSVLGRVHVLRYDGLWRAEAEICSLCSALASALRRMYRGAEGVPGEPLREFAARIHSIGRRGYPAALRSSRVRIPTAFRDEPLAVEDCFTLSDRALDGPIRARNCRNVLLVGIRTSGSYMAPLCAAALENHGLSTVSWLTLRPSQGLLPSERAAVRRFTKQPGYVVLVVDDAPYSGSTVRLAHTILRDAGVAGDALFLLVPRFDEAPFWRGVDGDGLRAERGNVKGIRAITLRRSALHMFKTVSTKWVASCLADCLGFEGVVGVNEVGTSPRRPQLDRFPYRPPRPFPRFVRMFEVSQQLNGRNAVCRVAAMSVGQGFWGYAIAHLAEGLSGLVPRLLALHQGVALLEWPQEVRPPARQEPGREAFLRRLGRYISTRASLPLQCGHTEVLQIEGRGGGHALLRELLSSGLGRLSRPYSLWLKGRAGLSRFLGNGPRSIIDSDLTERGWAYGPDGELVRLNSDYAAFDWRDLRIFDPLFDLASAAFEFDLTIEEADAVLQRYRASVDDDCQLRERLVLYRLLHPYALAQDLRCALRGVYRLRAVPPRTPNERIRQERLLERCENDLTETLNGHLGWRLRLCKGSQTQAGVFAIDVDGVLETERLGFSATSNAAVEALALLKRAGFLVTLNTGRSVAEARARCRQLGIPFAVAEHGAVLWDAARECTMILVGQEDREERRRLLRDVRWDKSIVYASGFVCGLRLFRRGTRGIAPIPEEEMLARFERLAITRLRYVTTSGTTDVCFRAADKGTALRALVAQLARASLPVCSVGDSLPDLPMFEASTLAYAPADLSQPLRERLAEDRRVRIAPHTGQLGLLWAVKDALRGLGAPVTAAEGGMRPDAVQQMASAHEIVQWRWPKLAGFWRI
jgi:hydroxymethylpyrimidine pyrophosphatase-like HAD family hydrolase